MSLSAGDAQIVYEFFMRKKVLDPRFFYETEIDEGHLRSVFWIDAKSRVAYENFGDVITFDTTYLTNKYAMKFAPFVGVNHHGQSILLGCALITDESKSSFVWVLKTWLTAMLGRPPRAIITDQDKAIRAAIEEVFPNTCHRYCLWHIMRKIPEKLGTVCKENPYFMYKFQKCIYDSLTVEDFEERWKSIIELYGLIDHEWLQAMHKCRAQWVPVFLKDIFFAGMSTSQRSESINSFFDGYVSRKTCLKEFVDQYELALQDRLNDEEKADFDVQLKTPHLKTGSPYECQMASIYMLEIFKRFQDEVLQIPSCSVTNTRIEGAKEILLVRELILKPNGKKGIRDYNIVWDSSDDTITCICRLFEFKGYLCRHAMVSLFAKGVYDIPGRYILKRWCKGANNRDLFDQESQEASHNSQEYIARCFTDLCADCIRFAEEGSLSKHRYEVAKHIIKEGLEKVSSLSKLTEDSFNQDVDVDDMRPADEITPVPIIQDPLVSSSKGRPPTKRIKGGTEKSTTKTRTNKCSFCRKPGHNILKCKEVTKNTDEVDEQPVLATTSAFSQMGDEHFEQPVSATPSIFSQVVTQSK